MVRTIVIVITMVTTLIIVVMVSNNDITIRIVFVKYDDGKENKDKRYNKQ